MKGTYNDDLYLNWIMGQKGKAKICLENVIFLKIFFYKNVHCTLSKPAKERAARSADTVFLSAFIDGQKVSLEVHKYLSGSIMPPAQRKITFQINVH